MITIQKEDVDILRLIQDAKSKHTGAMSLFIGTVRDDGIEALDFECHLDIAEENLHEIADQAKESFHLVTVDIIHRIGTLSLTDTILVILVTAGHRKEAIEGCSWILERIKETVPIWKKDILKDGHHWHD
ncbi:MAG: molybdenum cofactor biosynthesis protein MoaE [Methanomicrobiales archaeon]|jgi:molybdopterin synthase catalytic subunit|nr:molybdenum cofactor biosynthesis protein MoaE [Methanomicrobiales archaeon]